MISQQKIIEFNESLPRDYVHLYGGGAGLCAELVGILKGVVRSWQSGYRFSLGVSGHNLGTSTPNGWSDLFPPIFPEKRHFLFYYLNRHQFPYNRRLPFLRPMASMTLRCFSDGDLFVFDQDKLLPLRDRIVFPELGIDEPFWKGMSSVANTIFKPCDDIMEQVAEVREKLGLQEQYLAVHLRRGDKITEVPYTKMKAYYQMLEEKSQGLTKVFVASDDHTTIETMLKALPHLDIVTMSRESDRGYDQGTFNKLSTENRAYELKRFLVELRLMQESHAFVGSSTSNIFFLLQYMRGNLNIFDAQMESDTDPSVKKLIRPSRSSQ